MILWVSNLGWTQPSSSAVSLGITNVSVIWHLGWDWRVYDDVAHMSCVWCWLSAPWLVQVWDDLSLLRVASRAPVD